MKKFGLLIVGAIAALVLLANVGPLIGLAISLGILYYSCKQLLSVESVFAKIAWVIVLLIAISFAISSFPSVLGLVAAYILFVVYRKWNKSKETIIEESNDPFTNFEKQWADLNK